MKVKIIHSKKDISLEHIKELEKVIGKELPPEYKDFLLKHNGGRPKPAEFKIGWTGQEWSEAWETGMVHYFLAINGESADFMDCYNTFLGDKMPRIPMDTIPIARDPGGNLILLGVGYNNKGRVYFWLHEYENYPDKPDYSNIGFIANSFNEFLDNLFEE